ncbi:hypothetical protein BC2230_30065 [Burkholderia cepacia]
MSCATSCFRACRPFWTARSMRRLRSPVRAHKFCSRPRTGRSGGRHGLRQSSALPFGLLRFGLAGACPPFVGIAPASFPTTNSPAWTFEFTNTQALTIACFTVCTSGFGQERSFDSTVRIVDNDGVETS